MLVAESYLDFLKKEIGVLDFPKLEYKIKDKNHPPKILSPEVRACLSLGMKKYWSSITPEKLKEFKESRSKLMTKTMKRLWKNPVFRTKRMKEVGEDTHKHNLDIEKDVPRINSYSGVITETEMEEIIA